MPTGDAGELLFLLSSSDRLEILSALGKENLRLSSLASKLSSTVQETSRQLERLKAANLVEKDPRGLYRRTSYCELVVQLLPAFDFLAERKEYLRHHDLSSLPSAFIERLGELGQSEFRETLGGVLDHFQEVLDESREYVHLMADQVLLMDAITEKVLTGAVGLRIVVPAAVLNNEDSMNLPNELRGRIELGAVKKVEAGLALNERLAGVTFPDGTGKLDFDGGFRSDDPEFHRWCEDLFEHHWKEARRIF